MNTFETTDVDLAAYLMLQGLKFIECVPHASDKAGGDKARIIMRFFDEKNIARDLERNFMTSEIKRYRDFQKYLLKDIHRTQKGV